MVTRITALAETHEVNSFDCGNDKLNEFLWATARQHQKKFISKTYVLTDDDAPTEVLGFYTLAVRRMTPKSELPPEMAKKLPLEVPGLTLARLAVGAMHKRQGHGEYLLIHALNKANDVANMVGGYALFVDAKDGDGADFYKKYGFVQFPDDPLTLCLPFHFVQK
jgi:GNAT superfamily N-acetyltransferase